MRFNACNLFIFRKLKGIGTKRRVKRSPQVIVVVVKVTRIHSGKSTAHLIKKGYFCGHETSDCHHRHRVLRTRSARS